MLQDSKLQNIAITLLVLTAIILYIAKAKNGLLPLGNFIALAVLLALALVVPLAGAALALPVFLIAYMQNYQAVLDLWERTKKSTLNLGGSKSGNT